MQITQEIIEKMRVLFSDAKRYTSRYFNGLKELSEGSQEVNEQEVFALLGNAMSLGFNIEDSDSPFGSTIIMGDRHSFDISDFKETDWDNLTSIANNLHYPILMARVSDLLWTFKKDYSSAVRAVNAYRLCAEATFDTEHWVEYFDFIKKANRIALKLNKKQEPFIGLTKYIDSIIKEINGADSSFLSLSLIELMIDNNFDSLQDYTNILNKLCDSACQSDNLRRIEVAFELKIKLYSKLKDTDNVLISRYEYATNIERIAKDYLKQKDTVGLGRAIHFFKDAALLYREANKSEDEKRIRLEIEPLEQEYVKNMHCFSQKIDLTPQFQAIRGFLTNRNLEEKIMALSALSRFHTKHELEKKVIHKQKNFISTQFFTSTLLDEGGKTVAR